MSDLALAVKLLDCTIAFTTASGKVRHVAGVGYKSFRPTSDFADARKFERGEAEWWTANLNTWFSMRFEVVK